MKLVVIKSRELCKNCVFPASSRQIPSVGITFAGVLVRVLPDMAMPPYVDLYHNRCCGRSPCARECCDAVV